MLYLKNEKVLISIHMNKVFSSIYVFIFYTILVNKGVFGSIDGVDCKLLTALCQNDPSCGNSGVFYKKCLESSETIIEEKEYKNNYYNDYLNILFPLTGLILQNRKKELIGEFLKNGYKFLPTDSTRGTSEEYSTDPYVQLKTTDNNNQYSREYKRKIVRGAIKIIEELLQNEDKSTSAGESIDKKSSVIENRQVSDREDIAVVEYNSPDISHNNDIKPTTTDSYLLVNFTTTLDTQNNNTTAIYRIPTKAEEENWDQITLISAIVGGFLIAFFIALALICLVQKQHNQTVLFQKQEAVHDYQELLRTQMSVCALPKPDEIETEENMKQQTWSEDPIPYNMDISTGHAILTYMEDHLKNENRFNKEWEALCNYKSDSDFETKAATDTKNITKNRYQDVVPYDHVRVKLNPVANAFNSDYINASFIRDVREPEYIATQGPLDNTVADFWQMTWEQGVVVIVNLTKLADMGLPQCHRYWPEERSEIYHIYEVHLISEHIWCDDFVVRSLYLKNLQTNETRTVTQFHYLNWPDLSVPSSSRPLLEFRRKVNKCYRGSNHLVVVHCNNGIGRTGTYILLDMILNKMTKGAKEIDIAATLEHLRDQCQDMVKTRGQFDFALTAMAEEVTTILSSVSQR